MALPKTDNKVPEVSAHTATEYVQMMVRIEEVRSGTQENAMRKLAHDYKIGFWQLVHLFKGKAKTCDVVLFNRVRSAYLDRCGQMIAALQHEIEMEEALGGDAVDQDLVARARALVAEVAEKRAALGEGRAVK